MKDDPLSPSDIKGVNPDGLGPAQPRPPAGQSRTESSKGDALVPPPVDQSEMTDNLKRERSKGST
jgi:hypothetical protein